MTDKVWLTDAEVGTRFGTTRQWVWVQARTNPKLSALPDGADEVTVWQMVSAYLRGEVENLPSSDTKAPRPTAKQITRAEVVLELWHKVALNDKGDRKRLKRAVYLKASGMRPRAVRSKTGLNYQQLWKAQKDACSDLWEIILHLSQLRG